MQSKFDAIRQAFYHPTKIDISIPYCSLLIGSTTHRRSLLNESTSISRIRNDVRLWTSFKFKPRLPKSSTQWYFQLPSIKNEKISDSNSQLSFKESNPNEITFKQGDNSNPNEITFKQGDNSVKVTQSLEKNEPDGSINVKTIFEISSQKSKIKEFVIKKHLKTGESLLKSWQVFKSNLRGKTPDLTDLRKLPFISSIPDIQFDSSLITKMLPETPPWMQKAYQLYNEITFGEGSTADLVKRASQNPSIYPEIMWDAHIRKGHESDLCEAEREFAHNRMENIRGNFARYIGVDENEVDVRDIPNIGIAGSGGGYRAMIAITGYLSAAKDAGVFDVTKYMSGVSGSSWAMFQYFNIANRSFDSLIQHYKNRLDKSFTDIGSFVDQLSQPNFDKYILSGIFLKNVNVSMVDFFGTLLTARLLVPKDPTGLTESTLKISSIQRYLNKGENPMPIFTAVRHRRAKNSNERSYFQTFSFTPYEVGSGDFNAWVPTWAFGREFDNGNNVKRMPELHAGLLLGVYGSAFCATLAHYFAEIKPLIPSGTIKDKIQSYVDTYEQELAGIHFIPPAEFHNFMYNFKDLSMEGAEDIKECKTIDLADAGMHLNVNVNSLLCRRTEVLIIFDASSDFTETPWPGVAERYAKKNGIRGWPKECGGSDRKLDGHREMEVDNEIELGRINKNNLSHCNVWVGEEGEMEQGRGGISVVYFPLIANSKVKGINPQKDGFTSTWNFVYEKDEVDKLVELSRENFRQGEEQLKTVIRDAWKRKRAENKKKKPI